MAGGVSAATVYLIGSYPLNGSAHSRQTPPWGPVVDPHARDGKPGGRCRETRIKQPARRIDLPEQDKQCACGHSLVRIGEELCGADRRDLAPDPGVDQSYRAGTAGWLLYRYRTYVEGCECNERHQQHQPHSNYAQPAPPRA